MISLHDFCMWRRDFAAEAAGLNLPAACCAFSQENKESGKRRADLFSHFCSRESTTHTGQKISAGEFSKY